jgi:hypothetical protein
MPAGVDEGGTDDVNGCSRLVARQSLGESGWTWTRVCDLRDADQ